MLTNPPASGPGQDQLHSRVRPVCGCAVTTRPRSAGSCHTNLALEIHRVGYVIAIERVSPMRSWSARWQPLIWMRILPLPPRCADVILRAGPDEGRMYRRRHRGRFCTRPRPTRGRDNSRGRSITLKFAPRYRPRPLTLGKISKSCVPRPSGFPGASTRADTQNPSNAIAERVIHLVEQRLQRDLRFVG